MTVEDFIGTVQTCDICELWQIFFFGAFLWDLHRCFLGNLENSMENYSRCPNWDPFPKYFHFRKISRIFPHCVHERNLKLLASKLSFIEYICTMLRVRICTALLKSIHGNYDNHDRHKQEILPWNHRLWTMHQQSDDNRRWGMTQKIWEKYVVMIIASCANFFAASLDSDPRSRFFQTVKFSWQQVNNDNG